MQEHRITMLASTTQAIPLIRRGDFVRVSQTCGWCKLWRWRNHCCTQIAACIGVKSVPDIESPKRISVRPAIIVWPDFPMV